MQEEIQMAKEVHKILWDVLDNGRFELIWDDAAVLGAYAQARHIDGRMIDTREAKMTEKTCLPDGWKLVYSSENNLMLTEYLRVTEEGVPTAVCELSEKGKKVETSRLVPLIFCGPGNNTKKIWKSLWTQMLLVPYDNTMWTRYEAQPLKPGRRSYDLTVIFDESSREGLLVGAMDFSVWKNGLTCSGYDAKTLYAESGVADRGTHDTMPQGSLSGSSVASAPFCILYGPDYRRLLEWYGDLLSKDRKLTWDNGVPFGFNSWAGLEFRLNEENFRNTGKFLGDTLRPAGYENQGCNYVNMDNGWQNLDASILKDLAEELHENGQKAGIYDAPFIFSEEDASKEIPGAPGHRYEEILLRDDQGHVLPKLDGSYPLDVTHPVWKQQMKWKLDRFVEWGFDYLKMDFLSHGGIEGCHYDKSIRTGRQAIAVGYQWIMDNLSKERIGRDFFISLSIAPLFPHGYGHARRFACDAFGRNEDVEYTLNAETYSWWQNGRLYSFNDPDHICLLRSFEMERDSSLGEARARYTASVISGTVMMLSDDYERPEARERAMQLATNREVNEVARSGVAFCPVSSNGGFACDTYTAVINGKHYLAVFHWEDTNEVKEVDLSRAQLTPGTVWKELWSGKTMQDEQGILKWDVEGCDTILLEEVTENTQQNS